MKQFSKLMSTIRVPVSGVLISLALFFVLTVPGPNSASAQTTQTPQAYVTETFTFTCNCSGPACDAWCPPSLVGVSIVSPLSQTVGPDDTEPTWSADGNQIAFTRYNDIYVMTLATLVSITNTGNNQDPVWSPDGTRIAFMTTRDGHSELYLMNPDGSNVVRLTYNVAASVGHPAWSHDGARIAFNCQVQSGNDDICAINRDGSGFARLTTDPASDTGPTWSPDGVSIAFSTTRYGPNAVIAVMNADGSGVSQVGAGVQGWDPAWSPDGAQIAFDGPGSNWSAICTVQADGTNVAFFADDAGEPAWMPARVPIATFKASCNGTTCNFDASGSKDSYGTITSYAWNFGDGTTAAGVSLAHTYAGSGTHTVRLTATDNTSATGTKFQTVPTNPLASFTFSCNGLTCNFDGSGSKDLNATITSYAWRFGDGSTGAGATIGYTYAAGGSYNVALTVTDSSGSSTTQTRTANVNAPPVASFTFACSGLTCSFEGSASRDSDGTITSYYWNFGDGVAGYGAATVIHNYPAGGTYTVTLRVYDNGGANNAQNRTVIANAPPVASFTFSCNLVACSFNGSASRDSDGTITNYAWNFGDGAIGSGATVTHTYRAPGTYTVTLSVTDNAFATTSQTQSVSIVRRR